jgi:hypothetical protein
MSKEVQDSTARNRLKPLDPIADWDRANWARMRIDDGLSYAIEETARRRAPTSASQWRHRKGFAVELAAASYFGVEANWEIYDDYVGDDGYDFVFEHDRIEAKATSDRQDMELRVATSKLDDADYFVLGYCSRPDELAELIGYISRPTLEEHGYQFDGEIRVELEYLYPLEPQVLFPEEVRDIQGA